LAPAVKLGKIDLCYSSYSPGVKMGNDKDQLGLLTDNLRPVDFRDGAEDSVIYSCPFGNLPS